MTIQKLFLDVLKFANVAKIDVMKVTPTDGKLRMQSYDNFSADSAEIIRVAITKKPQGIAVPEPLKRTD